MNDYVWKLVDKKELERIPFQFSGDPESGQVRARTVYSSISPGTELAAYLGKEPLRPTTNPYPRLMGYCNVARIEAVGLDTSQGLLGQYIITHQSHRTAFDIPQEQILAVIPEGSDLVSASTCYLFHLGYSAYLAAEACLGQSSVFIGAGTLSLAASAIFSSAGCDVTVISDHAEPLLYEKFGGEEVITRDNAQSHVARYDHVIIYSGSWSDWLLGLQLATFKGRITVVGFPGRNQLPPTFNPLSSEYLYDKQLTIATCGMTPSGEGLERWLCFTLKRNCERLLSKISNEKLPARELVDQIFPAISLPQAYEVLAEGRKTSRTIVLEWG